MARWREAPSAEPALRERQASRFALLRCRDCATAVTTGKVPPALYETGAYGSATPRLHVLAAPLLSAFDRRRLALVAELAPPPGRLLDVGAGRGRFVVSARAAGYAAEGLEPSARGVTAAGALGVGLAQVAVEDACFPAGGFDAITVWHVLEHLEDPGGALARIATWLRPGGALLVGVPNLDSLQARLAGERWYHLDVPRHRTHFTPRGLLALLRSCGLQPRRSTHLLLEHNPFGMWQSLVNLLTAHPSYPYNLLKRNAPLHARDLALSALAIPLAPAAAALELAAGLAGRGGTIAVLATREG